MRGKLLGAEGSPSEGKGPTCRLGEGDHLLIPGLDDLSRSCLARALFQKDWRGWMGIEPTKDTSTAPFKRF